MPYENLKIMKSIKNTLLLMLFFSINTILGAQSFEAGLVLGTSFYNGDIDVNPKNLLPQIRPAAGFFGRYHLTSSWALRGHIFLGQIYGDEKKYPASSYRQERGFSFNSPLTELGAQVEWHSIKLDKNFQFESDDPFISLFGFGGLGMAFFNPKTDFNEPNPIYDDVSVDRDAQFKKRTASLIVGAGMKIRLTDQLGIGTEFGVRKAFSDYLDGISKLSGKANDFYYIGGVSVYWVFGGEGFGGGGGFRGGSGNWQKRGKRVGCPTF